MPTTKKSDSSIKKTQSKSSSSTQKSPYLKNKDGVQSEDQDILLNIMEVLSEFADKEDNDTDTDTQTSIMVKTISKGTMERIWYSLAKHDVPLPKGFHSLKCKDLIRSLYPPRNTILPILKKLYENNKSKVFINTHPISTAHSLKTKPSTGMHVIIGKMVDNTLVRIGKGIVIQDMDVNATTNQDHAKISVTELTDGCDVIHRDEEFLVEAIVDWKWAHLAINPLISKVTAQDRALGTCLRRPDQKIDNTTTPCLVTSKPITPSTNEEIVPSSTNQQGVPVHTPPTKEDIFATNWQEEKQKYEESIQKLKTDYDDMVQKSRREVQKYEEVIQKLKRKHEEGVETTSKMRKQMENTTQSLNEFTNYYKQGLKLRAFSTNEKDYTISQLTIGTTILELSPKETVTFTTMSNHNEAIDFLMEKTEKTQITIDEWKQMNDTIMEYTAVNKGADVAVRLKNFKTRHNSKFLASSSDNDSGATTIGSGVCDE